MGKTDNKEVAFFGKITAGITHEMKNVLAIINESSGLMEDILAITEDDTFPHKDRFKKTLNRILGQIQRGNNITTNLNRFAHSSDYSPASVDLNEVSEQMVSLASRFARLKNVILKAGHYDESVIIKTHPVALQMALFESIEIILDLVTSNGKIILFPRKTDNKYVIGVHFEDTTPDDIVIMESISSCDRWESLEKIMVYLDGTVETDDSALEILLYLPNSIDK